VHLKGLNSHKIPAKFQANAFIFSGVMQMNVWDLGPDSDLSSFDPYPIYTSISPQQ